MTGIYVPVPTRGNKYDPVTNDDRRLREFRATGTCGFPMWMLFDGVIPGVPPKEYFMFGIGGSAADEIRKGESLPCESA